MNECNEHTFTSHLEGPISISFYVSKRVTRHGKAEEKNRSQNSHFKLIYKHKLTPTLQNKQDMTTNAW